MKGSYKALEDLVWLTQLGLNMLLPAGHVSGRCMVGGEQLELAGMGVPAGHPAGGLAAGAQNFWYFAKEHMNRTKKEKPKRVGFNFASVNLTGGFPL